MSGVHMKLRSAASSELGMSGEPGRPHWVDSSVGVSTAAPLAPPLERTTLTGKVGAR